MTRYKSAMIWLFVASLLVLGLAACDAMATPMHQLPPSPPPATAIQPPGPTSTPLATVAGPLPTAVPLGGQSVESFRFVLVITDTLASGIDITRQEGEWTTTAQHMLTTISTAEGEQKTESYIVGNQAYFQDPQGKWQVAESVNPEFHTLMNPSLVLKQVQEKGDLVLTPLGTSMVNGVACAAYQAATKGEDENVGSMFTQGIVHIGLHDGWVYRFEFERAALDLNSRGVMLCSDYNTGIVIKAPM
ncbi:MAG: hypothetical protein KKA73_23285 [Chloroflexi bacterium]|nr:hypothetical protein [Chloroflexota bacterium]MBU1750615.1 hypothetical protein [Chloroflexota bacterium]